jgi:hypothetical protein
MPANHILERFYGTWRLVSYESESETGARHFPLGQDAAGILIYTREGFMSGQVMKRGHTSPADYIAYCGSFHLDLAAGEVVHRVEASLHAKWVGTEQRRRYRFSGDKLILSTIAHRNGGRVTFRLTWRRAASPEPSQPSHSTALPD